MTKCKINIIIELLGLSLRSCVASVCNHTQTGLGFCCIYCKLNGTLRPDVSVEHRHWRASEYPNQNVFPSTKDRNVLLHYAQRAAVRGCEHLRSGFQILFTNLMTKDQVAHKIRKHIHLWDTQDILHEVNMSQRSKLIAESLCPL